MSQDRAALAHSSALPPEQNGDVDYPGPPTSTNAYGTSVMQLMVAATRKGEGRDGPAPEMSTA